MISKEKAIDIWKNNGIVWFADLGQILCGRVQNIEVVKEPPDEYVLNLDHIKTNPAASDITIWAARKRLIDVYETAEECKTGHFNLQKRILGARIKTTDDLFRFMLNHDCKTDPIAHAVAVEKGNTLLDINAT